jgi:hypothetical protein
MNASTFSPASFSPSPNDADRRRFRVKHALHSLENALTLLDTSPAEGIQVAALERVRDDLRVVLRLAEEECLTGVRPAHV